MKAFGKSSVQTSLINGKEPTIQVLDEKKANINMAAIGFHLQKVRLFMG